MRLHRQEMKTMTVASAQMDTLNSINELLYMIHKKQKQIDELTKALRIERKKYKSLQRKQSSRINYKWIIMVIILLIIVSVLCIQNVDSFKDWYQRNEISEAGTESEELIKSEILSHSSEAMKGDEVELTLDSDNWLLQMFTISLSLMFAFLTCSCDAYH